MSHRIPQTWSRVGLCGVLTALLVWLPSIAADSTQTGAVAFSGQATVVRATVLGITTVVSDTGPLPSSGGAQRASLLSASVPGLLTVNVAHATTIGQGDRTRSEASVADLSLTVAGNTIAATFLRSNAMAVCTSGDPAVTGSSEIADLIINGQSIQISGQPNQAIALPNGQIVINEQQSSLSGQSGSITVNALHVVVNGIADVEISSAHADITCTGQPACTGSDFVTGGGWITGTPSGAKANFGVGGGIKNGALWGHLEYIDHGPNGPKVHGTGVTYYVATGPTSRHIEGTAEINGQNGSYQVDVTDNGEPGRNDTFAIRLSNGYMAGGTLGGGNIQLHKPCQ